MIVDLKIVGLPLLSIGITIIIKTAYWVFSQLVRVYGPVCYVNVNVKIDVFWR